MRTNTKEMIHLLDGDLTFCGKEPNGERMRFVRNPPMGLKTVVLFRGEPITLDNPYLCQTCVLLWGLTDQTQPWWTF